MSDDAYLDFSFNVNFCKYADESSFSLVSPKCSNLTLSGWVAVYELLDCAKLTVLFICGWKPVAYVKNCLALIVDVRNKTALLKEFA